MENNFTSCKFIVIIIFTTCEVAFYKLNIYDANFTNYHDMVESDFKGINLLKLCDKFILNSVERYWNRFKDIWFDELIQL